MAREKATRKPVRMAPASRARVAYCGQSLGPALHYVEIPYAEYMKEFNKTCSTIKALIDDEPLRTESLAQILSSAKSVSDVPADLLLGDDIQS